MKLLIIAILITVFGSVFLIRQSGYNPKPILIMKASEYESENKLGESLFRRFFKEAQSINNFYIICDPDECNKLKIWESFLLFSKSHNLKPRSIIKTNSIKFVEEKFNSDFNIYFFRADEFNESIIIPPSSIIFYMTRFEISRKEESKNLVCEDISSFKNLKCLSQSYSRRFYKKKFPKGKLYVGAERISNNKYVIYLN